MFKRNNIMERILKTPNTQSVNIEKIEKMLVASGINIEHIRLEEPHAWVMQSQYIYLDDGRCLLLKIGIEDEWTDDSTILNQVHASKLIKSLGISQPDILSYSHDKNEYGFRYILSESHKGNKLYHEYQRGSIDERINIYKALGKAYDNLHRIHNDWAGIWDGHASKRKYPIHPVDFYRQAEIYGGSCKYLMDHHIINKKLYDKICLVWDKNMSYLKERPTSLIHFSPFPWSIYLQKNNDIYSVTGLSSLGDFMWWDPMIDIAHLLYPPFMEISFEEKEAFLQTYTIEVNERAINLYLLLNRVCAMAGCYLAPVDNLKAEQWIKKEISTIEQILLKL
ncbi:MAG: hypothetical protein CVV61_06680 [Tenericutes bacterium HGW-Tenericutes-6]|nr:MAG: hypothetical protein CVV61_06680 [Tenericutes bacterium HGW-Tenericutes-6]